MIIPIKILILGDSGVGKTSLCCRYMNDNYLESYKPTVGGKTIINNNIFKRNIYLFFQKS